MSPFERAIAFTLAREGSEYTNRPLDHGGPTKFGVTQRTLANFRKTPVKPEDVQNLSQEEATRVYAALYWNVAHLERVLEPNTALILFDFAVTSGPEDAISLLQSVLNDRFGARLKVDGVLGNETYAALCAADWRKVNRVLLQGIQLHYARVCVRHPDQLVFLEGWLRRSFLLWEAVS